MTFLLDDTIRTAEPPEAELRALYETRPDLVRTPARVSFSQVFFRREQGDDRARTSLAALSNAAAHPEGHGDRLLLGDTFADQDEQALANLFGASFAQAVMALPADEGHGGGPSAAVTHR
ncbi:peptidylprolyl isomerase [Microvirga aerophila]